MSAHTLKVPRSLREQAIRAAAASPSGLRCAVCGRPFGPGDAIEADHITPASRGGRNCLTNIRLADPSCNKRAWRDYAEWEAAAKRGDAALAPWYDVETRFNRFTVCCDKHGIIREARVAFHERPPGLVGRRLADWTAELEHKGTLVRCTPLAPEAPATPVAAHANPCGEQSA